MDVATIITDWNKYLIHHMEQWDALPPIKDCLYDVCQFYNLSAATRSLPPALHPFFVRDMTDIMLSAWADDSQKGLAWSVLDFYWDAVNAPIAPGYIYILEAGPYYKIGKTVDLNSRIKTIELQMPFPVDIFGVIPSYSALSGEQRLHECLTELRTNGEWFTLNQHPTPETSSTALELIKKHPFLITQPSLIDKLMDQRAPASRMLSQFADHFCESFSIWSKKEEPPLWQAQN